MLFQVLSGFKPIFYTTHPNEEPVFIPKYRKKVLYGKLKTDVREIISTLCRYKDIKI